MQDGIHIIGELTIIEHDFNELLNGADLARSLRAGNARIVEKTHNKVVDTGLSVLSRIIGNNIGAPLVGGAGFTDIADLVVAQMQIGAAVAPISPANADTVGVTALVYTPVLVITYPSVYKIMFSGLVPITELIGTSLTEEALITANGKLFAKTTFVRLKTGASGLQFNHEITIGRV